MTPPSRPPAPVASPCVLVCTLDDAGKVCLGCARTLEEIGAWSAMSQARREAIMAELPGRAARPPAAR